MTEISIQTCDLLNTADEWWIHRATKTLKILRVIRWLVWAMFFGWIILTMFKPIFSGPDLVPALIILLGAFIDAALRQRQVELDLVLLVREPHRFDLLKSLHPSVPSTPLPKSPDSPQP